MSPETLQGPFVAGLLGGVIGGGMLLMIYISITRFMYKKRHAQMVEQRKKELNRARHLAELDAQKRKGKKK